MRPIVLHAVKLGAVCLDAVEHAVDYPGDALLELLDPARRKCRQQQAPDTSMLVAVHLRDELGEHNLIELLQPGPRGISDLNVSVSENTRCTSP